MEVPKDNTFSPSLPPVSGSLFLMAAAQMHMDGYFNVPTANESIKAEVMKPEPGAATGNVSQSNNYRVGSAFATLEGKR